mmetsp:Transcript_17194/g.24146  ORF Transcript_17194/g.24146 Transcript_17194/m.24146 type:complete len:98 (-) Transcript_17194:274-567(-)
MSLRTVTLGVSRIMPQMGSPFKPMYKDPNIYGGNLLKLKDGVQQHFRVIPQDFSLEANTKKIGFYVPNTPKTGLTKDLLWMEGNRPNFFKRQARVFM